MLRHWLTGTSYIAYQAPDEPTDPPEHIPAQGDPHGDEVLEGGPQDPPEIPETPAGETPLEPETPPAPVLEEPPVVHKPDWRDKELSRRKRRLDEEVTAKEALAAENKRLKDLTESLSRQPPPDPANPDAPPPAPRQPSERVYTQAELDAEADRRAEIKAQTVSFQRDFNSAVESANKAYGRDKVNEAIARISELGGLDVDHLNLVLATDDPAKVLFDLGSKPEEFQRIMELPYARRAVEFTKMGLKTETPAPRVSRTAPPVEPLGGSGGSADNRYSDKVDDAAWFAAEEKRAAEYAKRKRNW
jgi:hypothetical protein